MRTITLRALALAASWVTVPAAATIAGSACIYSAPPPGVLGASDDATVQFAQLPGDFLPGRPPVRLPPPPGVGHPSDAIFRPGGGFMLQPRMACEDRLHREAALQGYLKSRLRLTPPQREAWQKVEQAGEPLINRQHELCAQLPVEDVGPPEMVAGMEFAEKMLTAQVEFLRAIREPLRALADTLTPEQRATFNRPPLVQGGPL
jgi:LTXXQ motif family protein